MIPVSMMELTRVMVYAWGLWIDAQYAATTTMGNWTTTFSEAAGHHTWNCIPCLAVVIA